MKFVETGFSDDAGSFPISWDHFEDEMRLKKKVLYRVYSNKYVWKLYSAHLYILSFFMCVWNVWLLLILQRQGVWAVYVLWGVQGCSFFHVCYIILFSL